MRTVDTVVDQKSLVAAGTMKALDGHGPGQKAREAKPRPKIQHAAGAIVRLTTSVIGVLAGTAAAAALGYAGYVAVTWCRYGRNGRGPSTDSLLDRFIPRYEVRERHQTRVHAPASVTFVAAKQMSLQRFPIVRAILALRSIPSRLGGTPAPPADERGIVEETLSLGWGVLAETPDREVVMGAVTQPWKANVVFRALPPEEFAAFSEPGYVKIAWTLRADPAGPSTCVFRSETRAIATDAESRARFRRYWAFLSPGIVLIRYEMLRQVRSEAERSASARSARKPVATYPSAAQLSRRLGRTRAHSDRSVRLGSWRGCCTAV